MDEPEKKMSCPARKWKRVGMIAFLFFFVKGLVWLGLAVAGAWWAFDR